VTGRQPETGNPQLGWGLLSAFDLANPERRMPADLARIWQANRSSAQWP
jgi:hypothetical protein